ncbi:flagellar hook capping FlgD N-terminal domain-containing protein [Nocardioides solisilvae]|uniref:flagellar hook capping FlgD N-terminal domain-containing protein n=1 Tax=Nocardioides solisilvae TaxID=1542435 RepID=UPI0013A5B30A|nr:flagellar hook capping FlgD N-terminal domain-containing protein [Nocardioides solisilvae]
MSIPATEAVSAGMFGPATTSTSTPTTAADKDMFLQLMVAQMRYQDPLNPADSGEFLAQTAQFTALEKMQAVADQTALLLSSQMAFGAAGLVGREVAWTNPDGTAGSGLVSGVVFGAQGPVLDVGGTEVPLALVSSVTAATSGDTPS